MSLYVGPNPPGDPEALLYILIAHSNHKPKQQQWLRSLANTSQRKLIDEATEAHLLRSTT